jgi:NAD(P)H-dependent FMN reductase
MDVIGISGSLRRGSYNTALLRAAAAVAPDDLTIERASIADVPLYDADREREEGIPEPVRRLKDRIASADGLLLATPEYNNSLPGVFKNAIDWLTRPPKDIDRVFGDRRVGMIGATPGRGGTRLAQLAWLPVFRTLGMRPWLGKQLHVAGAAEMFDADGELVDDEIRRLLTEYVAGFAAFLREPSDRHQTT